MAKKNYKVGDLVYARNESESRLGNIEKVEESTGARKGTIYNVGHLWFFDDEIKSVLPSEHTPNFYYDAMADLRGRMDNETYNLVIRFGKTKKEKNGITRHYIFLSNDECINISNGRKIYCVYTDLTGEEQVRGHLFFIDGDGNFLTYQDTLGEEFNIYSGLFRKVYKKELR